MDDPKPSTSRSVNDQSIADENENHMKDECVQEHDDRQNRLNFLMQQAEVFAHFVNGTSSNKSPPKKNRTPKMPLRRSINHDESGTEKHSRGIRFEKTPAYINGEMRDYQLRGLNWLISLYENNINGILADEMGLGKTLQTISILGFLKFHEGIDGPFLVIGPKSTLQNWMNEIDRFCPKMNSIKLIGDKAARNVTFEEMFGEHSNWDVCCTTFNMILSEPSRFRRFDWSFIVVDEAHRLKNEKSQFSRIMRSFHATHRLLLTGTPLQNNLHELWALLNYLLPDVFASSDDFDTWFDSDDCLRGNTDIVKRLHAILKPFMLRRVKADVEKSLLPKIEVKLFVGLTELQRQTYVKVLRKEVMKTNAFGEETPKKLDMILQELRKAANHPYLIDGIEPQPYKTDEHLVNCCGKMMLLDKLLTKLKAQGSRVLIFSQFVIMLNILDDYLDFRGHSYRRLDGSTPYEQRASDIDDFNAAGSDIFVYLISTRAGGLGINLATADTVIVYDSDWNPQSDLQAIDRAHRIGQKKQVRVFRLVTENTVDERIVQRAEIKLRLDNLIIQQGRNVDKAAASKETMGVKRDILRFGMDKLSSNEFSVKDIDIDEILKQGAIKTAAENAKLKDLGESQLRNMTLEEASSTSLYQFDGIDYRSERKGRQDNQWKLRERRAVQYFVSDVPSAPATPKLSKPPKDIIVYLNPFHFYPQELLEFCNQPRSLNLSLNAEAKKPLFEQGFRNWSRPEYKIFCDSVLEFGRDDITSIAKKLSDKTLEEVTEYHKVFFDRGPNEIQSIKRLVAQLKAKETQKYKQENHQTALNWKMAQYIEPELKLEFVKRKEDSKWTVEQDRFLACDYHKYGVDDPAVFVRIRCDVLKDKRFRCDWFMRSRTARELEERIGYLMALISKEFVSIGTNQSKRDRDDENIGTNPADSNSVIKKRKMN